MSDKLAVHLQHGKQCNNGRLCVTVVLDSARADDQHRAMMGSLPKVSERLAQSVQEI